MRIMRHKAFPSRLDPFRTKACAGRSCVETAGGVNGAARCQIWKCTTNSFAVTPAMIQKKT
jgi:hypothetical protein